MSDHPIPRDASQGDVDTTIVGQYDAPIAAAATRPHTVEDVTDGSDAVSGQRASLAE